MSEEKLQAMSEARTRLSAIEDGLLDILSKTEDQANCLGAFCDKLTGVRVEEGFGGEKNPEEPPGKLDRIERLLNHIRTPQDRIASEIQRLQEIA